LRTGIGEPSLTMVAGTAAPLTHGLDAQAEQTHLRALRQDTGEGRAALEAQNEIWQARDGVLAPVRWPPSRAARPCARCRPCARPGGRPTPPVWCRTLRRSLRLSHNGAMSANRMVLVAINPRSRRMNRAVIRSPPVICLIRVSVHARPSDVSAHVTSLAPEPSRNSPISARREGLPVRCAVQLVLHLTLQLVERHVFEV
jgi:hypothetical protein